MTSSALSKDPADHVSCNPESCDLAPKAAKVRVLSEHTDPTTERMRQETGHDCVVCPSDIRNLTATAHNALNAWDSARTTTPDWGRVARKMEALRDALALLQSARDEHFAALDQWRRP